MAVQTVLRQDYWAELKASFLGLDALVVHIVLDADEATLRNRIENDRVELSGKQWRMDHLEKYAAARHWMTNEADLVIDTSRLTTEDVVSRIAEAIGAELPPTHCAGMPFHKFPQFLFPADYLTVRQHNDLKCCRTR